jgi:hypothetical protein
MKLYLLMMIAFGVQIMAATAEPEILPYDAEGEIARGAKRDFAEIFTALAKVDPTPKIIREVLLGTSEILPEVIGFEDMIVSSAADVARTDPTMSTMLSTEDIMTAFTRIESISTRLSIVELLLQKEGNQANLGVDLYLISVLDHPKADMGDHFQAITLLLKHGRLEGYPIIKAAMSMKDTSPRAAELLGEFAPFDGQYIPGMKVKIDIKQDLVGISPRQLELYHMNADFRIEEAKQKNPTPKVEGETKP